MSSFINNLRDLNVAVMHPKGKSAEELLRQIHRIGCPFEAIWPMPSSLPKGIDVLFVDVDETSPVGIKRLLAKSKDDLPTIIAMIEYENPSVLEGDDHLEKNDLRPWDDRHKDYPMRRAYVPQ